MTCNLDKPGNIATRLKEIDAKMSKKYIRQALRPAAKIVQAQLIADSPAGTGNIRGAFRVRAAKRSRKGITMVVSLTSSLFKSKTFYAGFVNYGWNWTSHRMKSTGRLVKRGTAKMAERLGRLSKATTKHIEGTHWLNHAFDKSAPAAITKIVEILTKALESEGGGK
jgi:hypothetical protein